jgi:hypothetical protein
MSIGTIVAAAAIIATEYIDIELSALIHEESKYPHTLEEVAALDLSFLNDSWAANMLRDAMNAVVLSQKDPEISTKEIDVWDYLSTYEPPSSQGFMFSSGDTVVECVQRNMRVGHSGCSMAVTMRHLQLLAKIGMPQYREGYSK